MSHQVSVDGIIIEKEEFPSSQQELSAVIKNAHGAGSPLIPIGGGTKLDLGNPPRSPLLAVGLRRLSGIVEYEPDNLTVSVQAGTTLVELQDALKSRNQFLPLDPPHPEQATIGGLVACNASGPLRFHYGTIRDMLIGVKIVHADGTSTKAGGKLVKNVTGYDMCKLYTGSLGTLGILSELTFKVQPRPEKTATAWIARPSLPAALESTQALLRADLAPEAVEAWNSPAFESATGSRTAAPWLLIVRFGEVEEAVRWQVDRLHEIMAANGGEVLSVLRTEESEKFWRRAASARETPAQADVMLVKCSVLYQSMAETARLMEEMGHRLGAGLSLFCHAGTYIIYGRYCWEHDRRDAERLRGELKALREHCGSVGGHMVVEKVRPDVKAGLDVWGYGAPALELMRRIKKEFDPKGLLNPGRFVGGI